MARLGVYHDGPFRLVDTSDGVRLAPDPVDAPFFIFVAGVGEHFDSLVFFARVVGRGAPEENPLLPAATRIVALPDSGGLRRMLSVARASVGTAAAFWRGLADVDVVWTLGPHPFEFLLVLLAVLRRKRVVLGARQDTPAYFRARLPSSRWKPLLAFVDAMDALHRALARVVPTTVVGAANAKRYESPRGRVLAMTPSLVPAAEVVAEPRLRDWSGEIELLTVGRIDAEKNPGLAVELMRRLPERFRLRWVGTGPMADVLHACEGIELSGYVPFGPELLELYRAAHLFVHISLTEGVPQVLIEAMASGTPIVATDVGGVKAAVGDAGLLVPPNDAAALEREIVRLSEDDALRTRLARRGLELARERTLEAEAARVAGFLLGSR